MYHGVDSNHQLPGMTACSFDGAFPVIKLPWYMDTIAKIDLRVKKNRAIHPGGGASHAHYIASQ